MIFAFELLYIDVWKIKLAKMQNRILVLFLAVISFSALKAQDSLQLSLSEAQTFALNHNRELKNASLDIKIAEASRWQALATMLPQVSLTADYTNMFGYSMDLGEFKISMPNSITFGATAAVALSGAQVVGVQMKKIAGDMADITHKQTEQQVADQVKTLYFSALVTGQTVELLEKNLVNLEKMKTYTESSVAVGISEQTDADRIAVQVASMKNGVNSAKRSLEMVYNALRLQLGLDVNTELELTQGVEELLSVNDAVTLLDSEFMLNNNFSYQLLQENLNLSKKQISLKKWEFAPSLTAFYSYTKKEFLSDEPTMNSTPPNMFGMSLKVPIFSSWSRMKGLEEAKLGYQKQLNSYDTARESLIIQHRQLAYNLSSSFENYETQKENLVVVQRMLNNVSQKYEQGMSSSLDLTNAGTELINAQSTYVQSLLDLVNAQIELEQLLNTRNN